MALFGKLTRKKNIASNPHRVRGLNNLFDQVSKRKNANYQSFESFMDMGSFMRGSNVNARVLFRYYNSVSAIATAVEKIVGPLIDVPIRIKDNKDKLIEEQSKELDFLKKPNCFQTYRSFMKELSTNLLVAGNTFIKLTGDINKPPLEMINISPCDITIEMSSNGEVKNYVEKSSSSNASILNTYHRLIPTRNNCHRYVTADKKTELIHIKDLINCHDSDTRTFGVSKLTSLLIEIEQLVKANLFNYSTLVRSAELSLIVVFKQKMLQEEFEEVKSTINNEWSGAERAGQVGVLNGEDIEIKDISKSIKDMDYKNLKDEINRSIYTRYQIPLALVSEKTMTFNNLATANFLLYDDAIIPTLNIILESLNLYVLPRFGDNVNSLFVNRREISALETRQNERVKILSQIGVLTQNELRKELGFNEIDGGDVLPISALKAIKHLDKEDLANVDFEIKNLYDD